MPRSEPFEAAVRAGCDEAVPGSCNYPACGCKGIPEMFRKFLVAALPADPAPEMLVLLARAYHEYGRYSSWDDLPSWVVEGRKEQAQRPYRAFRASLLPGEEPS